MTKKKLRRLESKIDKVVDKITIQEIENRVKKDKKQAIQNLTEIIELYENELKNKDKDITAVLDYEDIESLQIVLILIKEQEERMNYLENSRKQAKEQMEEALMNLGYAIDMLTDV